MKMIFVPLLLMASAMASAEYCTASKQLNETFPASSLQSVQLSALAGSLEVRGEDTSEVSFRGKACTDSDEWLERIILDVVEVEGELQLTVIIPHRDRDFDPEYARMDVELTLPSALPVSLRDSSGDIVVQDVTLTAIDDSSGGIRVRNTTGDAEISDSSGDINVRNLKGNLRVSDSSGAINVRQVHGDVYIPNDSSGEIDLEDVRGAVIIDQDSSGDIDVSKVGENVSIGSDGSGGIRIRDVQGAVRIESDGSGNIYIARVKGDLEVGYDGSGAIQTRDISGRISIPE